MRERKFRGLPIEEFNEGVFVYGSLMWNQGKPYIVKYVLHADDQEIILQEWCPVDPNTVGQCIGFKDKEEKEVYEGDICWTYEIGLGNLNRVVSFDEGSFCLTHHSALTTELRGWIKDHIKIIGNIHQNKGLIE